MYVNFVEDEKRKKKELDMKQKFCDIDEFLENVGFVWFLWLFPETSIAESQKTTSKQPILDNMFGLRMA